MSLFSNSGSTNVATMTNNGYLNSSASQWTYKVADEATMYSQVNGDHRFSTAASGSAGGAITWLEKFRITADGNVGISTTSPAYTLDVNGNIGVGTTSTGLSTIQMLASTTGHNTIHFGDGGGNNLYAGYIQYSHGTNALQFGTSHTEKMRLNSAGGISFNGDSAAANALDDYEEGTFTPTFSSSNSTATGSYTKVGNKVTVHFHVVSTGGLPSGGSQVQIGNFPFTSGSSFRGAGSLYIGPSNVSSAVGGGGTIVPIMQGSEAFVRLVNIDTGTLGYTLWGELEVSHNNVVTAIGTMTYTV